MSQTATPLTRDEQIVLKRAAFGAVHLLSLADTSLTGLSAAKENMAGARVLSGATGIIGHALNTRDKVKLKGTAADVADEILPALSTAVATLDHKAPDQAEEFRKLVTTAVDQAARSTQKGDITPAQTEMINKIVTALGTASF
ncbi:MAG: hypothetical protein JO285_03255, partial [Kutzneria sp.]|nr:hypothetical protein [Kutzneria sp.]